MQAFYVDIHIHTSEDANKVNNNYDVNLLLENISKMVKGHPFLLSLTDHNVINKYAYLNLYKISKNVIIGAELHIKKYKEAPPYHCHILFDCEVTEENIDSINSILDKLYPDKMVTDETPDIPNIETITNEFDNYEFILLPHGGQSHRTFDKATAKGHRFDTSMEKSIYYNQFDGFTARSNTGLEDTLEYFKRLGIDQFTNLITCSDNYDPRKYPSGKNGDAEPFIPTWIFSNPTFTGLKMALSEKSRLFYGYEPPEKWGQTIFSVKLENDKCSINVKMSPGLNVVIGGSSSGKTLFVDSIVNKLNNDFSPSKYCEFGVDKLIIDNPNNTVPHYINQNFIMSVLQSKSLELGDIELIKEVFPEDKDVTEKIRNGKEKLRRLIQNLIDSVELYENNLAQLKGVSELAGLIISKEIPQRISELLKPSDEEKEHFSLTEVKYEKFIDELEEVYKVFADSSLDIPYKNEIETLKTGLKYIYDLSKLSDNILLSIDNLMNKELNQFNEDNRENTQKIQQRDRLKSCLNKIIKALSTFYKIKEELSKFNITATTREIKVDGHKLSIINSFALSKEILVDTINSFLKNEKRITSFEHLKPEDLFKVGFSQRPKVNSYSDFINKMVNLICEKDRKTYKITTRDNRDFDKLSPGWKTAVILDLLLAYEKDVAPLIIDQPEDNLATDYINHGLIEQIKKIKPQKQIILVSHNATIPMLGDAQNVITCKNENGKIIIKSAELESNIDGDRVLDLIANITDGGKQSIRKRVKKYDFKKI
jgi:hypothetical protein